MDVRLPAGRYREKTHYKPYPWPHNRPETHRHSSVSMGDSHDDQYPPYYTFRKTVHHIDPPSAQMRYNYPYDDRVSSSPGDPDGYHKSDRWQEPDPYSQDWHDWQDWYGEPEEWYAEKPRAPTYQPYLQNGHRLPYDRRYLHRRRTNEAKNHSDLKKSEIS
ncbi:uncharacterized protein LOC111088029 [Limulus polyphemus]|uniref:Uncharacterized protein LOC111088029 n=1 Tax=Limulus polyphemus TaxID=6850 RepID=A0ABM1T9D5_LIMPO|nr:uncharacterized protein LOC111088029 [Limulus polyphemus]